MTKMQAAIFNDVEKLDIETLDVPQIRPNEVLVELKACAFCTWEQRVFTGVNTVQFPFIGGHEESGVIRALGADIDPKLWHVGERVVVGLMTSCGDCHNCRIGQEGSCTDFSYEKPVGGLSVRGMGGFSEYLAVPITKLFPMADNLSYEEAALTEPLSCVVHSIDTADVQLGDTVVVIGAGIMGAFHAILARQRGARVIIDEPSAQRQQFMADLGFQEFINPKQEAAVPAVMRLTGDQGADIVFNTVGNANLVADSIAMAAIRGKVMLYSSFHPDNPVQFSPNTLHRRMTQIMGSANSDGQDFFKALNLLNTGVIDVKPFIAGYTTFADIEAGMRRALDPETYRIILRMNQ